MDEFLKKNKIERYSSESEFKAAIAERFNRTLKTIMWKYFSANNTHKYVDILNTLLQKYNNTMHRTIGMTPIEASRPENEAEVFYKLNPGKSQEISRPKFKVGDTVRISKYKAMFDKGYWPNWTEEIFKIAEINPTTPVTYKIKDTRDEILKGSFYEKELQKTNQEIFRLKKVIKRRVNKDTGIKEAYVKWRGYSDKFNQWIPESNLIDL